MKVIDGIDFAEYLTFRGQQESQSIVSLSSSAQQAWKRIDQGVEVYGQKLPWEKSEKVFRLRPQEVTVWAGSNGSGKSTVVSQVAAGLIAESPVMVASFEMPITAIAEVMARQLCGGKPDQKQFWEAMAYTDDRVWVYDENDTVAFERVLGASLYAATELQCKHIVIDSLVKCGIATDDFNGQKEFVDRLCWLAKTYDVHFHLIHHVRKRSTEQEKPDKFDIKGAGEITDLVDNVVLVWRNKGKEDLSEEEDARLMIRKQRHGEWEGDILLWYDQASRRFLEDRHGFPLPMFNP